MLNLYQKISVSVYSHLYWRKKDSKFLQRQAHGGWVERYAIIKQGTEYREAEMALFR